MQTRWPYPIPLTLQRHGAAPKGAEMRVQDRGPLSTRPVAPVPHAAAPAKPGAGAERPPVVEARGETPSSVKPM